MTKAATPFPLPNFWALALRCCATPALVVLVVLAEVGCGRLGQYTSLAMGGDGLGLISYEDGPNDRLKVAHCEDAACTRATISIVDAPVEGDTGGVGAHTALAIGVDGLGLISYDGNGLRVAHCEDTACTRAQVTTLDAGTRGLDSNSLVIGRDGLGLVVYWNWGSLRTAHCEDVACTRATLTSHGGDVGTPRPGGSASIAIGSDGLGIIAYPNSDLGVLRIAHCEDVACTAAVFSTIDTGPHVPHVSGFVGDYPDIAIGADGLALISYYDSPVGNLRVAHCADLRCTTADVISTIDRGGPSGRVGTNTSLAIGPDGQALISYHGSSSSYTSQNLKVAHCQGLACATAIVSTVDPEPGVGEYTSVAFGPDGLALISYLAAGPGGFGAGALRVAHCQDASCTRATVSTLEVGPP